MKIKQKSVKLTSSGSASLTSPFLISSLLGFDLSFFVNDMLLNDHFRLPFSFFAFFCSGVESSAFSSIDSVDFCTAFSSEISSDTDFSVSGVLSGVFDSSESDTPFSPAPFSTIASLLSDFSLS